MRGKGFDSKRWEIIAAAKELLARDPNELSLDQIVRETRLTLKAVHTRFRAVSELTVVAYEEDIALFERELSIVSELSGVDAPVRLAQLHAEFLVPRPMLCRALQDAAMCPPAARLAEEMVQMLHSTLCNSRNISEWDRPAYETYSREILAHLVTWITNATPTPTIEDTTRRLCHHLSM